MYKDFTFDMADLAYLLKLEVKHRNATSWDVNCPFCQDKKGKMNLNLVKKVFRCNLCGESGGMLDLYGKLYGVDHAVACKEIKDALGRGATHEEYVVRKKDMQKKLEVIPQSEPAPDAVRHKTYMKMLSLLTLAVSHEEKLKERGFTVDYIRKNGYKSTPAFGYKKLVEFLTQEGCTIQGVPGFYQDKNGGWTVNFSAKNAGILVPVRNMDGCIVGMQTRLDHPYDGRKYIWLSSANRMMGVTSKSPVHFVGEEGKETVYVTEGPLKADLSHNLSGRSFVAVAGVTQYGNLPPVMKRLKEMGTKLIYEAYDMDKLLEVVCQRDYKEEYCRNCELFQEGKGTAICPKKKIKRDNIQNGCRNLYRICHENRLKIKSLTWDTDEKGIWNGDIKGVDDYLFNITNQFQRDP